MALRTGLEPERGLYLAESEKVIRRALRAGHRPRSLPDGGALAHRPRRPGRGRRAVGRAGLRRRAPRDRGDDRVPPAPWGAGRRCTGPSCPRSQALLAGARRVVVLEDIVDHTNVGAIFRGCAALGVDAVLVTPRCADPLYRRSVRVSMGTVFQVPWTRIDPWPGGLEVLRRQRFPRRGPRAGRRRRQPGRARRRAARAAGPRARRRGGRPVAAHDRRRRTSSYGSRWPGEWTP